MLTEYPLWLGLLCLALAALGAWFLYRHNPLGIEGQRAKYIQWILHGLRFGSLFIISFLLLGPLVKLVTTQIQKPTIVFAVDNSASLNLAHDSIELRNKLLEQQSALQQKLGSDYEVVPYLIGEQAKPNNQITFTDKQSNLNALFYTIKNTYDGGNLGAVILASDGLYNSGENPIEEAAQIKSPVYTIALGDTVQRKDVLIKNVRTNQLVFNGNSFPIQVDVAAYAAAGSTTTLSITQNGQVVFKKPLLLTQPFFTTIQATLSANQNSTQHLIIEVSKVAGEVSIANNRTDVFVDVIDGKQKVALVAYTPHPDVAAYQKAIQQNQNYHVDVFTASQQEYPSKLEQYNLVMLHQLPGLNGEGLALIKQLKEKNIPLLYILGAQTNLALLNQVEPMLQVAGARGNSNEVLPIYQNSFSLFTVSADEQEHYKKFPPLIAPFGNYRINGEAEVFLKQQIGYIKTDYPLVIFGKGNNNKTAFICGEGFWKWRMYDMDISSQQTTNNFIGSTVQFLTSKKNQNRFRVNGKKQLNENEHVIFDAELYNESYQLLNTAEVTFAITDSKGKKYNYTFNKVATAYNLDAGTLPPGNYTYLATAGQGASAPKVTGSFIVKPMQLEFVETTANHQLLNQLAVQSGGSMFYLNNLNKLVDEIEANENIKPIIYQQNDIKSWIELAWLLGLIVALLSIEWFIRKWHGSI